MNNLIVNADDYGLHTSVNSAIEDLVEAGTVNSISIMANGLNLDFDLLKNFAQKRIFLGIHISWVGESWITDSRIIPGWRALVYKTLTGGHDFRKRLKDEAEQQINKLIEKNVFLDHIDSHQHVHHFPWLWEITMDLKNKYEIKRIRNAHANSLKLMRINASGITLNVLSGLRRQAGSDFFSAGIKHAGNYNINMFSKELEDAAGHNTELIVHPGKSNSELNKKYGHWNFDWENEFQALKSNNFLNIVKENNFTLIRK